MSIKSPARFAHALALCAIWSAFAALPAAAAGPYPTNMCAGTRTGSLGCSANDVAIAEVTVTNGVTSCVAGTMVDVGLQVKLQTNANSRYDIGVFVARDGKPAELSASSGGSADCAVFGVPKSPSPLADLNGNACGDINKSSSLAVVDLGTVSVLCVPGSDGNLKLPTTVTWDSNANGTCNAPPAAWVEAGTSSKCSASPEGSVPIQVTGALTIVKQTSPANTAGNFAFTATGGTPSSFSLAHGKQQVVVSGPLGTSPTTLTVTESALSGWDPTADITCKTVDGGPASFVTIDKANRRVTASFTAANSRATCTFTNKPAAAIRIVKRATGGDGSFEFTGARDFNIATSGGTGEQLITGLAGGTYSVTEVVPAGWQLDAISCTDPSGNTQVDFPGKTASIGLAAGETVECVFTNSRQAVASPYQITLVARQCTSYTDIMANRARNNIQESLKDLGKDTVYASGVPIARAIEDANDNCAPIAVPWTFTLGRNISGQDSGSWGKLSKVGGMFRSVTTTVAGVPERDPAGNVVGPTIPSAITIDLTSDEQSQVSRGLWIQGGSPGHPLNDLQDTYAFGALRCAIDNLNGDNVESNAYSSGARHIFCYAYYVVPPPTSGTINVVKTNRGSSRTDFVFRGNISYTPDPALPGVSNNYFTLSPAAGGSATSTFYRAAGSTWNVREDVPAGWTLTSASCQSTGGSKVTTNATGDFSIALVANDVVTCTYVNDATPPPATATINVVKKTTGGDGTFAFQAFVPARQNFSLTTTGGTSSTRSFTGLAAGPYTVVETVPAGWSLGSIACVDPTGNSTGAGTTATINLAAGETVTCTFTNVKDAPPPATINVVKKSVGGDGTFPFTGFVPTEQAFSLATAGGTSPTKSFTGLAAGTYNVVEQVPAGWSLTSIGCVDPTGNSTGSGSTATINVAAGETVTCTFTNTKNPPPPTGAINLLKKTTGGNGSFSFTSSIPGGQSFSLTTASGTSPAKSFTGLAAGVYTVTEQVPAGWSLASISCADPTGNSTGSGATATISLADAETVACTFTNAATASVVVEKVASGGDDTFAFSGTSNFSIATSSGAGRDTTTYASVAAGSPITISETVPAGWIFAGASCRDAQTNAPLGIAAPNGRVFTPAAGQQVICTFTNTKLAQLTIVEVSSPKSPQAFAYATTGPGLANFTLFDDGTNTGNKRVFANLVPGQAYKVTQDAVAGWTPPLILCSDRNAIAPGDATPVDGANRSIAPSLQPGENLTCVFVNVQATPGSIAITKTTSGGDGAFAFTNSGGVAGSANNPASFTITTASGGGSRSLTSLAPGTYTITEAIPSGWLSPAGVQCSVVSGTSSTITPLANGVTINLGQTGLAVDSVGCAFDNTKAARITTVEDATPDSPQAFPYTAQGTGVPASFTLVNDGTPAQVDRRSFDSLAAGPYAFSVATPAGWRLTSIKCPDAKSTVNTDTGQANVTLAAGDDVTCTFRHSREGTITITKAATGAVAGDTFTFTGPAGLAGSYAAGQSRSAPFLPGTYSVAELVPSGWTLTNIACTGGSVTYTGAPGAVANGFDPGDYIANITIAAGDTVACTFTNAKNAPPPGTINVVKTTTGGNGTFSFIGSMPGAQSFSLTTSAGTSPTRSFNGLAAGVYTVTEQVPAGWSLTSISCVDPTGNSAGSGTTATINVAAGETVTCTFANTASASVVVEKTALGGDDTFAFAGTRSFAIVTDAGAGRDTATFASVVAGAALTITEAAPAGWVLSGAGCRDATSNAALGTTLANGVQVTPMAGQQVICTFTNTKLAQLVIAEVSAPKSPQAFAYTSTGAGLANFTLFDDGTSSGNTRTFANLVPGQAYTVTQGAVAGWITPVILCSDRNAVASGDRTPVDLANRSVSPNLQPGEVLVCGFGNVQVTPGSIVIQKGTTGGDGPFAFTNSGGVTGSANNPASFSITTVSGGGSRSLTSLAPGTYTITEAIPAGWLGPAGVQCSVASGTSTTINPLVNGVTVNLGQTGPSVDSVSCSFDNTRAARITIVEDATPDSSQAFPYTAQGTGVPATFTLVNDGTPTQVDRRLIDSLAAGPYQFNVATPAGWRLTAIKCVNAKATVNVATGQANVTLAAGDDATCTFRHSREGTITITKSATSAVAGDIFPFDGPTGLAGDYAAGQSRSATFLPGTYSVSELVPEGWTLSNIACTGGSVSYIGAASGATEGFEAGDNTAVITVAAADTVVCTFTNAPSSGGITIEKVAVGGAGVFAFTGVEDFQIDTRQRRLPIHFIQVPVGTHTVREIAPADWRLTGLTCTGNSSVNLATATATITIAANERVRCTYTNEKLGRIEITKAIRGETSASFSFSVPASLDPSQGFVLSPIPAEGTATRVFTGVPTGTYAVTENAPPSPFRLLSIDCVDPTGNTTTNVTSGTATINVAPGETVSCTYTNVTTATLLVGAVSFQGQDRFSYTIDSGPARAAVTFTIETTPFNSSAGFGSESRSNLLPAVYTVSAQSPPPGWRFTNMQCVSNSGEQHWTITGGTATITLPDGEAIRCYYFYEPTGGLGGAAAQPIPVIGLPMHLLLAFLLAIGAWGVRRRW